MLSNNPQRGELSGSTPPIASMKFRTDPYEASMMTRTKEKTAKKLDTRVYPVMELHCKKRPEFVKGGLVFETNRYWTIRPEFFMTATTKHVNPYDMTFKFSKSVWEVA